MRFLEMNLILRLKCIPLMSNSSFAVRQTLINDLKDLQAKKITCADFSQKYDGINTDKETKGMIPDIRKVLSIYMDDEKIRTEDANYKEMQEAELEKLIELIESNASPIQIKNITFLDESEPLTVEELKRRKLNNVTFFIKAAALLAFFFGAAQFIPWLIKLITGYDLPH